MNHVVCFLEQFTHSHAANTDLPTGHNLQSHSANTDVPTGHNLHLSELRRLHKAITNFLILLLEGGVSETCLQQHKTDIKNSLSHIMNSAGCSEILRLVFHDIDRSSDQIMEAAESIDCASDADRLRYVDI